MYTLNPIPTIVELHRQGSLVFRASRALIKSYQKILLVITQVVLLEGFCPQAWIEPSAHLQQALTEAALVGPKEQWHRFGHR